MSRAATLIVYLDTSALVKLVFDEPGSEFAAELWDRAKSVASSQHVYPEARAAQPRRIVDAGPPRQP